MKQNKIEMKGFRKICMLFLLMLTVCISIPKTTVAATNGFVTKNGHTYYYENGKMHTGWLTLGGYKYYFGAKTGIMQTGWITNPEGKKRYFYKSGKMATGWVTNSTGNKRYFYTGSGIMATGWVTNSAGEKRYFDPQNGYMASKWMAKSDGRRRYFGATGGIMYTGLRKVGTNYYYFDPSNGWNIRGTFYKVGDNTYYFSPKYGTAKKGWMTLNKKKYYFSTKGVMYVSKTATIDGKKYKFDKNGVATEVKATATPTPKPTATPTPKPTATPTPKPTQTSAPNPIITPENPDYVISGNNVYVTMNGRRYSLVKEFLEHPGIADGSVSDVELLAALCECEAGGQGLIGMEAVAMCILNRATCPTREFPANIRYVIYNGTTFPQYSPVRDGSLLKRLNGFYYNKDLAMQAAKNAIAIMDNYVKNGKPRTIEGFPKPDFDYMYFMSERSFWAQPLDFDRVENFLYVSPGGEEHMFFVDWVSPKR